MRILFVAMAESVHTARWINQLADQGWDIHLFPSNINGFTYSELANTIVHHLARGKGQQPHRNVKLKGAFLPVNDERFIVNGHKVIRKFLPNYQAQYLARIIRRIKPDMIHMLEMSYCSQLTVDALKLLGNDAPPLIVSDWGDGLQFFRRLPEYSEAINEIMARADYFTAECERDIQKAKELGFRGTLLPVILAAGGYDIPHSAQFRQDPPSSRKRILLKGYQELRGRALVALRAMELCKEALQGYSVGVYSVHGEDVRAKIELMAQSGMNIEIIPRLPTNDDILRLFGEARIYMGLSMSDGTSTSMLQAMITGTFPIQSYTACANEWVTDGETGFLVPPEDPHLVAEALRRALTDDALVDAAAEKNRRVAAERLDYKIIQPQVIEMYKRILEH